MTENLCATCGHSALHHRPDPKMCWDAYTDKSCPCPSFEKSPLHPFYATFKALDEDLRKEAEMRNRDVPACFKESWEVAYGHRPDLRAERDSWKARAEKAEAGHNHHALNCAKYCDSLQPKLDQATKELDSARKESAQLKEKLEHVRGYLSGCNISRDRVTREALDILWSIVGHSLWP